MSTKIMALVWEHSKATGADRLVILALADLANDDGWCDPRIARLGRMCLVDNRTVKRALPKLVRMGELTVERGAGFTSRGGRTNRYWIKCHPVTSGPASGVRASPDGNEVQIKMDALIQAMLERRDAVPNDRELKDKAARQAIRELITICANREKCSETKAQQLMAILVREHFAQKNETGGYTVLGESSPAA